MTYYFPARPAFIHQDLPNARSAVVLSVELALSSGGVFPAVGINTVQFGSPGRDVSGDATTAVVPGFVAGSVGQPLVVFRASSLGRISSISKAFIPTLRAYQANGARLTKTHNLTLSYVQIVDRTQRALARAESFFNASRPVGLTRFGGVGAGFYTGLVGNPKLALPNITNGVASSAFGLSTATPTYRFSGFRIGNFGAGHLKLLHFSRFLAKTRFGRARTRAEEGVRAQGNIMTYFGWHDMRDGKLVCVPAVRTQLLFGQHSRSIVHRGREKSMLAHIGRPTTRRNTAC